MKTFHFISGGRQATVAGMAMACAMLMAAASVKAAIVVDSPIGSNGAFTVSAVDLLQTHLASSSNNLVLNAGENAGAGGKTSAVLTNGVFGDVVTNGKWESVVIDYGKMTYTLNTSVNTLGFSITSIVTYAGWADANRGTQAYTVEYSTVASTGFTTLATVPYTGDGLFQQKVSIRENTSGILASGVDAIRFNFGSGTNAIGAPNAGWTRQENSGVGYKELDVFGTATEGLYNGPVTVPNYSFESPATNAGSLYFGAIPGWTPTGSAWIYYPNSIFNAVAPLGAPAHSNQCAMFETGTSNPGTVALTTSSPLGYVVPRYRYTLTVAVGHGKQTVPPREPDDYMIELLVNGSTVASNTLSNAYANVPFGGWLDLSTAFIATEEQRAGELKVRISHSSDDATYRQGAIDNVRVVGWLSTGTLILLQ